MADVVWNVCRETWKLDCGKCDILKGNHVETLLTVNWLTDPLPKQYVPMLSFYESENTVGVHVIQT